MNLYTIIRRRALTRSFAKAYRGSLIKTVSWKTESGLSAFLWGAIVFMLIAMGSQLRIMFLPTDLSTFRQPPRISSIRAVPAVMPEIVLEKNLGVSLFQLPPHDETLPTLSGNQEKRNSSHSMPNPNKPRWLLKVERPLVADAAPMRGMTEAAVQMQEGRVHSARKTLLAVLQQDPHNVEVMAALAKLARELGEVEAEQTYLQILRQEIPEYDVAYEPANAPASQD